MTQIALVNSAQVLIRPDSAIQFGIDATRAGVLDIDPSHSSKIVPILRNLRTARPIADVIADLTSAGLAPTAAASLLDDLLAFGVLRESAGSQVLLFGDGSLVDVTSFLLETSGFIPRPQIIDESPREFLELPSSHILVLNQLASSPQLAPLLNKYTPTYLCASIIDSRGIIGPGRRNRIGPCLMCVDLHHCDIDPHWLSIINQQPHGPTFPDPVTEMATAARLVAWVTSDTWRPGVVEEVNPHDRTNSVRTLPVHPRCPMCWNLNARA
ncbi:hypothetical protein N24_0904 [Corynebacterium suranareeae]|uniref:Bacteriocin biosynthesis cyclodehydratase domain-containing protein n=1 Tax=Corynebacterium suranareeae TaxID=2506452 RepID=A0A160PP13_9CORY|nr:hypothetical protein [Corynebacterium suranareeae]BAU95166.1 hypothetical protein N24_0904 [Corynebacterium suranareeae]